MNREAELERAQERFRQDTKEVQQEVKYLEYDHKITLEQLKAWESSLVAKVDEENLKEMLELLEEKRKLKEELAEHELKFEEQLMSLKKQHEQELMEEEKKNEEVHIQKEMEFKRGLVEMKEEMTLRHEMELSELEERKNCHLIELKNIHKRRLDELKKFFNSVTAENLAVISCLRESLDGISKTKVTMADDMDKLKKNNKKLQKPLEKSKADVKNLTRQLTNYQKDLSSLKNNKRLLEETNSELQKFKKESIAALMWLKSSESLTEESIDMCCIKSMVQFRSYAVAKRKQLQELTDHIVAELDNKRQILNKLSDDPDVTDAVSKLNFEYWCPNKLNYELSVAKAAYDQALSTLDEKLAEFCVPESTLGQGSWKVDPAHGGPAGLVAKQL